MASSQSRRRPVYAPVVEDLSHRVLNYAIRNYVFKDAGSRDNLSVRDEGSVKSKGKGKDKEWFKMG